jgi:hypothetical protein
LQLIEKGGLAKKMLAMDVLLRLAVLSVGMPYSVCMLY